MEIVKSKVYVLPDDRSRILRCEGGYTTPEDLSGWVKIDEGVGDRYNLCQSYYFEDGLYTNDGIPKYKLVEGIPVKRSDEEIQADRDTLPKPEDPNKEVAALREELVAITAAISKGASL